MGRSILAVAVLLLTIAPAGAVAVDWMELEVWKYYDVGVGDVRYGSAFTASVDGVTGPSKIYIKLPGLATAVNLPEVYPGEYSAGSEGWTLAQLDGILAGANQVTVNTASGACVYDFTTSSIPDSLFAPLPVVTAPGFAATGIPQDVTCQWTWAGDTRVSRLWAEVTTPVVRNDIWAEDDSDVGGTMTLSDLSWQPMLTRSGWATMFVGYDFVAPMDGSSVVSSVTFNAGLSTGTDFGWDRAEAVATAEGRTGFQVVPEPVALSLLAAGGVGLLGRRRGRK